MSNSEIILHDLNISNNLESNKTVSITAKIDNELLYFQVPISLEEYLTYESFDAFLLAALPLALLMGKNLRVKGLVSEKLFYNVTNYLIPILRIQNHKFQAISIYADGFCSTTYPTANAVGCAMSCGVDSFATIELHSKDVPPGFKITHFLNLNAGAVQSDIAHALRFTNVNEVAEYYHLPIINILSNTHKVIPIDHPQIHNIRNCSAILVLQKLIKRFYYSSGSPYVQCGVFKTTFGCDADPIILPLISTETTEFISAGVSLSRIEKTKLISSNSITYKQLDVCVNETYMLNRSKAQPLNCSQCGKCLRTLLMLDILGKLDLYKQVFDLDLYRKNRDEYIELHMLSPDDFTDEIFNWSINTSFVPVLNKLKFKKFKFVLRNRARLLRFLQRPKYYLRRLKPVKPITDSEDQERFTQ